MIQARRLLVCLAAAWTFVSSPGRCRAQEDALERADVRAALEGRLSSVEAVAQAGPASLPPEAARGGRNEEGSVYPAGARPRLAVPPDARAFLPDYMTTATKGSLWPKDSSLTQEIARELSDHFRRFYPDVVYLVDWDSDVVNAYAWVTNGTRHVALYGGLLRHKTLGREGVALVLAHELGHHYGGAPTYPSGLSCEGQADYWAGSVGMPTAWGEEFRRQMIPAIEQITAFFTKGVEMRITPEEEAARIAQAGGCTHPPAACRRETYEAAMEGLPKPECAGPTIREEVASAAVGSGTAAAL